jgi:hypothetical protein
MLGTVVAVLSAASFAATNAAGRRGVVTGTPAQGMVLSNPVGVLCFLIVAVLTGEITRAGEFPSIAAAWMAGVGVLHFVLGRYVNFRANQSAGTNLTAPAEERAMIAEEYLSRSRLYRRLRNKKHGELVELYASHLAQEGLARRGTWRCLSLVGDLLSWIARSRSKLSDLDERIVERYPRHRARKQSIQPGDRAALKRWLSVLRDVGTIAPAALPPMSPQDQIFAEFSDYLQRERGLAPRTIVSNLPAIRRFLREVCPAGAGDLAARVRRT